MTAMNGDPIRMHVPGPAGRMLCMKPRSDVPYDGDHANLPACGACLVAAHLIYDQALHLVADQPKPSPEEWTSALAELVDRGFFGDVPGDDGALVDLANYYREYLTASDYRYPERIDESLTLVADMYSLHTFGGSDEASDP
jgi:hypothetical protein